MQSDCLQNPNLDQQKSVKDFKLVPSGLIETAEELEKSKYLGIFCFGENLQYLAFLGYGGILYSINDGKYLTLMKSSMPAMRLEVKS